jgi:hypothetical protein
MRRRPETRPLAQVFRPVLEIEGVGQVPAGHVVGLVIMRWIRGAWASVTDAIVVCSGSASAMVRFLAWVKYPPAKPGALLSEPLNAVAEVAGATPVTVASSRNNPEVATSFLLKFIDLQHPRMKARSECRAPAPCDRAIFVRRLRQPNLCGLRHGFEIYFPTGHVRIAKLFPTEHVRIAFV